MDLIRKIFRRPAVVLVTLWANRTYKQGVRAADERAKKEHRVIYLASQNFHLDRLKTYSKEQFKAEKKVYGYKARLLTMGTLKAGCYYHTPNRFGEGMGERDKEIRRRHFIRERLRLAKLI